ncbi:MAG: thermonuclease family protein [Coriobacteriales bacterium]|jgi:micrococcal nuclease|nr:thermonuclease family protein [Coriobacteriales bacterium]
MKTRNTLLAALLLIVFVGVVLYQLLTGLSAGLESGQAGSAADATAGASTNSSSEGSDDTVDSVGTNSAGAVEGFEQCTLVRVVDGDTIIVRISGQEDTVRLIGIDAPESVHPDESKNTPEGAAASAWLSELLTPGQTLWLQKDTSDRDQYDRLLRYVWLQVPTEADDAEQIAAWMLNARLVQSGHAQAKRYPPDTRYARTLEKLAP